MLLGVIALLFRWLVQLVWLIVQLVVVIVLAIVDFGLLCLAVILRGIRWALPVLLRVATVALWLAGVGAAFLGTLVLYQAFDDPLPSFAVALAAAIPVIAIPVLLILQKLSLWGAFTFAALVGASTWLLANWVRGDPALYPIAGVTPTIIASAGMMFLAVKYKSRRKHGATHTDQ